MKRYICEYAKLNYKNGILTDLKMLHAQDKRRKASRMLLLYKLMWLNLVSDVKLFKEKEDYMYRNL